MRVVIDSENLDYVLQNSTSKESALADAVTIGGVTVQNVGLKTKGNMTNNSTSDRFSFTINFGKYVKKKYGYSDTQNFFGCSKISFNNFYFDKSMMKEYNAFRLMTEMGLPTPQYGLAKLYINNTYYGVYFMVEAMETSILAQYYDTSTKNLTDYLVKPAYYSPRYYSPDLDDCIGENGVITWEALVNNGYLIKNPDGTYRYDKGLIFYTGLWENDDETFQEVVKELPSVLTWVYRITQLSNGKDFDGNTLDVNSEKYLELLNQIMDVEETVKYFATHSFLIQMDNLFTWRQNYGLYINQDAQSLMVPWDYDLSWGCNGDPADGESVANWNVDKLYNHVFGDAHYYTDNLAEFYAGNNPPNYYDQANVGGSGYPLFNVIYQNSSLMKKYHSYINDCSKIATMGGTTSTGKTYTAGRFGETIDQLYDEVVDAAGETLASNVYYLNGYEQPSNARVGLQALKNIIALRSVGAWLQVNQISAKVTGYGYQTGALGNDAIHADYTTYGNNLAVVDDETGIFTIANYDQGTKSGDTTQGPTLTGEVLKATDTIYQKVKTSLGISTGENDLTVYKLTNTKAASGKYKVFLPCNDKTAEVYSYSSSANSTTKLTTTAYGQGTIAVSATNISYLAVVENSYKAGFETDNGVESIDVYYSQNYVAADEQNVTETKVRNGDTGVVDVTGEGQVNFRVNLKNGYKIKSVTVAQKNYKNIKTPAETENPFTYRITKVKGDITISVVTEATSEYKATFTKGNNVKSIDIYHSSVYGQTPDELDVTDAVVLNSNGETDTSGEGQINFRVNVEEGYVVKEIQITGAYYKNLKLPEDTGAENVYRITKVTGDIKVEVTAMMKSEENVYEATFNKDEGVSAVDVYYTQDYTKPSETDVSSAVARNSSTGLKDVTGDGQINFMIHVKEGYELVSVTATPEGSYKNLKDQTETNVTDLYRITKITGNLGITIVTKKKTSTPIVTKTDLSKCTVTLEKTSFVYDGKAKTPGVTVKSGSKVIPTSDLKVTYTNNINAGKAYVTITPKNTQGYTGSKKVGFIIKPASNSFSITGKTLVLSYKKTARQINITMKPKFGKVKYTSNDRKVTIKNGKVLLPAKFTGTVKITVSAEKTNNYGAAKCIIAIKVPSTVKMRSAKMTGSKKAVVSWRKIVGVSGYQVSYAKKSSFRGEKMVSIASAKTEKKTLKQLSRGT